MFGGADLSCFLKNIKLLLRKAEKFQNSGCTLFEDVNLENEQ